MGLSPHYIPGRVPGMLLVRKARNRSCFPSLRCAVRRLLRRLGIRARLGSPSSKPHNLLQPLRKLLPATALHNLVIELSMAFINPVHDSPVQMRDYLLRANFSLFSSSVLWYEFLEFRGVKCLSTVFFEKSCDFGGLKGSMALVFREHPSEDFEFDAFVETSGFEEWFVFDFFG
ncbi:hypothetical protein BU26DRAFT_81527 [Trematosphaeria pertusa]|uniref:Uncharacterized protein n=1 Tax=Trematosphaeria pertusa TaxID=390896 RepID=A0A6A6I2K5_9PLEO|nr:uncharacterized protein BU26DRAFT_81527 [Trematosphaeria pertusa]KAF2244571.1 hypothetical protein BU26DRAFT_81527 [Trematosphaeria pertusa]